MNLAKLLEPPSECQAHGALKMPDRRKGSLWFCPYSRRLIGKGRKHPGCKCAEALGRAALNEEVRK